jgi:hypothetical protein
LARQRRVVVVFNLPGLHDATVSHAQQVEGAEFDLLLRGVIFDERALVRAPINQAGNDLVPRDEQVLDRASQVGDILWKAREAALIPSGPCRQPSGSKLFLNVGPTAASANSGLPVSQKA